VSDAAARCVVWCGVCVGAVKYGECVLLVGGEDDKSWMAGMYSLSHTASAGPAAGIEATANSQSVAASDAGVRSEQKNCNSSLQWAAGQELPVVMSTFGCVVTNVNKQLMHVNNSDD